MSPILRRLGRTLRRRDVDLEVLAAEAAANGGDSAQGWEYACRMAWASNRERQAVLDRIDATLREHDHRLTTDLADDVARALRVECARGERLLQQSETFEVQADRAVHQSERFEAELIAVDEALAKAGATLAADRVDAVRALTDQRDTARARRDREQVATVRAYRERDELAEGVRKVLRSRGYPTRLDVALAVDNALDRLTEWFGLALQERDQLRDDRARALLATLWRRDRLAELGDVDELFAPCTCGTRDLDGRVRRDRVRYAPDTSRVDPRCPEHSPAWRYGGRPAQPLALPPGTGPTGWPHDLGCDHQLVAVTPGGAVVHQARCRWLAGHTGLHGNASGRTWTPHRWVDDVVDAEIVDADSVWDASAAPGGYVCGACGVPTETEPCPDHQPDAVAAMRAERGIDRSDPWCSADLDGARCARPADHAEPCRPAEPVPVVRRPATGDVAQCAAHPFGVRCALVAGHPGTHTSAGLV